MWIRTIFLLALISVVLAAKDFYKELGVDNKADDPTIKKAYKKLARKYHPDKNKDADAIEKFASVSHAYEVLMDTEKRKIYDRYGEEGPKQQQNNGNGFHDPRDVFSQFFGGRGGQEERRGPSKLTEIEVDLGDFYRGRDLEFEMDKNVLCDHCRGTGAASDGDVVRCGGCNGQGVKVQRAQVFPGMYTNMQVTCPDCQGKGTVIRKPCPHCHSAKIIPSRITLSLHLPKGAPEGFEVVFDGDADESPDWDAGDVIVRVRSRVAEGEGGWGRKEGGLVWRETLGVEEALLGFNRSIIHMDGHEVDLSRKGVTQPGYVQVLEGEGMPTYGDSPTGNLYVHYSVVFPNVVPPSLRSDLESAFRKTRGGKKRDEL